MLEAALIGAGPIGIECAIALKKAGISFVHLDKGQAAQTIFHNFPPQTHFFSSNERISIAGIPIQTVDQQKCMKEEYLAYIRSVVMHYQLDIHTYEEVIYISKKTKGFELLTQTAAGKRKYQARYLLLATGGTAHPRLLNIPGEDYPHISVRMQDVHNYFQKRVVIIGGKNSAVESALRCFQAGARVTLVVRKSQISEQEVKFWLLPEFQSRVKKGEIEAFYLAEPVEFLHDRVLIKIKGEQDLKSIPCDFVIKAIGFEADMSLFRQLGVELTQERDAPLYDENTMQTNVRGVFVLGTATAGTQTKFKIFIENTHVHVEKIVNCLCRELGYKPPAPISLARMPDQRSLEE